MAHAGSPEATLEVVGIVQIPIEATGSGGRTKEVDMFEQIVNMVPEQWRGVVEVLLVPISWIPGMQDVLLTFFSYSDSGWAAAAKFAFLIMPVLLWVTAVWCTLLAVYTVPFRSNRVNFFSSLALGWWDGARAVWLFWVGTIRAATVIIGWGFTLVRLALKMLAESVRQIILLPFTMTGKMTESYFKPGVPWIAFVMLLVWCALETTIFTYTLFPHRVRGDRRFGRRGHAPADGTGVVAVSVHAHRGQFCLRAGADRCGQGA
jgi:hypothetical protein